MKYLAGVIKTFTDIEKLCHIGPIEGHVDADSLRLRENILPSLTLLPHQTAVIPRLLHMEINQIWRTDGGTTIASNIICYSEQFGTGKTRTIIALICIAPLPLKSYPLTFTERKNGSYQCGTISVKNMRPGARLTPNMVVVKSDVVESWRREISVVSELKAFTITNVFEFAEFYKIIASPQGVGRINSFDIILVKFGDMIITDPAKYNGETESGTVAIVDTIARVLRSRQLVLSRVIMDDYEQWAKSAGSIVPDASSYIAVSATSKDLGKSPKRPPFVMSLNDMLEDFRPKLAEIATSDALKIRRVACEKRFVKFSVNIPTLELFRVMCEDNKGVLARVFGAATDAQTRNIVEALNGDAVKTTAEMLNISATTPADIYAALMRGKEKTVAVTQAHLAKCRALKAHIIAVFRASKVKQVDPISAVDVSAIDHWLRSASVEIPDYIQPKNGIMAVLDQHIADAAEAEKNALRDVNIIREMLAQSLCELCKTRVCASEDAAVGRDGLILECCGKIVCRQCYVTNAGRRGNLQNKRLCPLNARHKIENINQIVYLSGRIDMSVVIEAAPTSDTAVVHFEIEAEAAVPADQFESIVNEKLRALARIIHGADVRGREQLHDALPDGVVVGSDFIPQKDNMRKVIVFAKETETIENIQKMLEDQNVNYAVIGGGHKRIQEIIDEFRDNPEQRVLLLQSERYASGINLQFATDLVFYHRLHDSAIEKQAIGRIQRFGRKCSGRVWYLLYAAEE